MAPPEVRAPDVRENVKKALKWLADKQNKDGTWTGNNNNFYRTLTTSYCGLALLMEGSTLGEGSYSANLRLTVAWFEKIAQPSGALFPAGDPNERGQSMQSHAAALLFLASAHDTDDDQPRRLRRGELLDAAVKYAVESQTSRGGWGFIPARDGNDFDDSMTSVFMLQALRTAEKAGAKVPRAALDKAAKYLVDATSPEGGITYSLANGRPRGGDGQPLPTAGAAAIFVHADRKPATLAKWVSYSRKYGPSLPRGDKGPRPVLNNSYTLQLHLVVARVARGLGDGGHRALDPAARETDVLAWSTHREALFRYLTDTQVADGYWIDQFIGPAYGTALALIILQLDNNHLPAFGG